MHRVNRSVAGAVIAAAAVLAALTGCGATSAPNEPLTARMTHTGPHGALSVVLTPLGVQRVGVQTAAVATAGRGQTVVPYSALLYQPDGRSVVYTVTGPLASAATFTSASRVSGPWCAGISRPIAATTRNA